MYVKDFVNRSWNMCTCFWYQWLQGLTKISAKHDILIWRFDMKAPQCEQFWQMIYLIADEVRIPENESGFHHGGLEPM